MICAVWGPFLANFAQRVFVAPGPSSGGGGGGGGGTILSSGSASEGPKVTYFTRFSSSLKKSKIYGGPRGGLFEAPRRSRRAQKCRILRGFQAPLKNLRFMGVLVGGYLRHRVGLGEPKSVVFYEGFELPLKI